eukprot:g1925.t1
MAPHLVSAATALASLMLLSVAGERHGGNAGGFVYHGCITEENDNSASATRPSLYCVHSLAPRDASPGSPLLPSAGSREGDNTFPSRDAAASMCQTRGYDGLVDVTTVERNKLAARIVDSLGVPHWLGGDDWPNGVVTWADGTEHSEQLFDTPWHKPSGQPNDRDGPGSETCIFMGPGGNWFDFACHPKTPSPTDGITAGPEIDWTTGAGQARDKTEYNVWPLCGGNVLEEDDSRHTVMSRNARRLVENQEESGEM